jgi:hypothetical protein
MNTEHNVERVLQRWLVDGIDEMPDRVYLSILDRVERQPQRRAWRVPRRDTHVNGSIKPLAAVAAVVAIALVGIAFVAKPFGPSVGISGASASPPSPSAAIAPSPSLDWRQTGVCGDPDCGGPQYGGTYTSQGLRPQVTYTLRTPWVNAEDWPEFFLLYKDTRANRALAAAGDWDGDNPPYILIQPGALGLPSRTACGTPGLKTGQSNVPTDVAGFIDGLEAEEGLTVTEPGPITVSGLDGTVFTVVPEDGWTGCLPGTPFEDHTFRRDSLEYYVFDTPDGSSLLITVRGWDQPYVETADAVVQSFAFDFTP